MSQTSVSVTVGFPGVPEFQPNEAAHRKQIARKINSMNVGKFNVTLDVTLNANTGATVISDSRIAYSSAVGPIMPMTLSGSVALAAGIWCNGATAQVASTTASITVHHANAAATDQTIRFVIFG